MIDFSPHDPFMPFVLKTFAIDSDLHQVLNPATPELIRG